jgi:hypothetical protein
MQIERYKEASQLLSTINKTLSRYFIIHYSCESFFNLPNGASPRIASIAIRSIDDGQTDSFSIHKTAERNGMLSLDQIKDHYDELELDMLEEYMEYISHHTNSFFIHWNMRDSNYGFKAIEHRYLVLQNRIGKSTPLQKIPDTCKIDLPILFVKKYGNQYIEDPQMPKLIDKNQLNPRDFLTGKEEAEAFTNQEYAKLHLSTLSKTRAMHSLLLLAIDDTLKTNSSWIQTHGYSPQALWTLANEKWYFALLFSLASFALGKYYDSIASFVIRLMW